MLNGNNWEVRKLFAEDGRVLACFFGHKHRNRWTVHDGCHALEMQLRRNHDCRQPGHQGIRGQRSYQLPLPKRVAG